MATLLVVEVRDVFEDSLLGLGVVSRAATGASTLTKDVFDLLAQLTTTWLDSLTARRWSIREEGRIMSRGQGGARRPAMKFPQLQKKIARQSVQKHLQSRPSVLPKKPKKGLP